MSDYLALALLAIVGTIATLFIGILFMNDLTNGRAVANILTRLGASEESINDYWRKRIQQEEEAARDEPLTKKQLVEIGANILIACLICGAAIVWFFIHVHQTSNIPPFLLILFAFAVALFLFNLWMYRRDLARMQEEMEEDETAEERHARLYPGICPACGHPISQHPRGLGLQCDNQYNGMEGSAL